jgi:hypothetical protein
MDDVAPGILLEDDSRSIAKGLTSKTDRVLSKTSLTFVAIDSRTLRPTVQVVSIQVRDAGLKEHRRASPRMTVSG